MNRSFIVPAILILVFSYGCRGDGSTNSPESESSFLVSFQNMEYAEALEAIDKKLMLNPEDGKLLYYKATCLEKIGRHEQAAGLYRLAGVLAPNGFADRVVLYTEAQALFNIRVNSLAQRAVDELARKYPHSQLTKKGQQLAMLIEERLSMGITVKNLNWYLDKGYKAYAAGNPELAAQYMEEFMLLAQRADFEEQYGDKTANFTLGSSLLEIGDPEGAITFLDKVPVEFESYRAGLLSAMANYYAGKEKKASSILDTIISNAEEESVVSKAKSNREKWFRP